MSPFANTTFKPNQQIVIELQQGLNDLSTLSLHGKARTTGAGNFLPPAELLIDSVSIEVGGVSVQNGFTNYGDLFNIFRNLQMEDKRNFRKVLQLEDRYVDSGTGTTDSLVGGTPFSVWNWLGFLGSVKVLDTTLLPPVKIYIRLAPSAVVTKHSGSANAPDYELTDVRANIDLLDISDGVYYNMISQRLAQAPLEIVFDNFQTVTGGLGAVTQSTRWSTSSDCLEAIIATFKTATPNSSAYESVTKLSEYFTRGTKDTGAVISKSHFKVNGIPYPSIPCETDFGEVFADTAHSLGLSQDTLGATDPAISSLKNFNEKFFVHAHTFSYPDAEDSHRLCGLSGRTNMLLGTWETEGTGSNQLQPIMWLKSKSILRVGAGRMVEVVQ
jgi:hypothetical protein